MKNPIIYRSQGSTIADILLTREYSPRITRYLYKIQKVVTKVTARTPKTSGHTFNVLTKNAYVVEDVVFWIGLEVVHKRAVVGEVQFAASKLQAWPVKAIFLDQQTFFQRSWPILTTHIVEFIRGRC